MDPTSKSNRAYIQAGMFTLVIAIHFILSARIGMLEIPFAASLVVDMTDWLPVKTLNCPAGKLIATHLGLWLCCLFAVVLLPKNRSFRFNSGLILAISLICRILILPMPANTDVNRYMWEGRLMINGLSPYGHSAVAVEDPDADSFRTDADPVRADINHPEMTAIYAPLSLLFFGITGLVSYTTLAVKVCMTIFDLGALWFLLLILRRRHLDPRWSLLYALNPVILFGFAGEGHIDAIQVFMVVIAVYLFQEKRWLSMFICLGLAVQVKYLAIMFWPFFFSRQNRRYVWAAIIVAGVPLIPFLTQDGAGLFRSLLIFSFDFAFNGPIHSLINNILSPRLAAVLCGICFIVGWMTLIKRFHPGNRLNHCTDPVTGIYSVYALFLLFSPTVHLWYLTLLIPFICIQPIVAWIVLTGTAGFSYIVFGNFYLYGHWHYPAWAMGAVWALPFLLLLRTLYLARKRRQFQMLPESPSNISVIIPTKNEADHIAQCIDQIKKSGRIKEIFDGDSGSI